MFLHVRTRKATVSTAAKQFWFDYEGLHYLGTGGEAGFFPKNQILEFSVADFQGEKRSYLFREVEVKCIEDNFGDNIPAPIKQRVLTILNLNNGVTLPAWLAKKEGWITIMVTNPFFNWVIRKLFDKK